MWQVSVGEGSWCHIQRMFSLEEKLQLLSDLMVIMEGGATGLAGVYYWFGRSMADLD